MTKLKLTLNIKNEIEIYSKYKGWNWNYLKCKDQIETYPCIQTHKYFPSHLDGTNN